MKRIRKHLFTGLLLLFTAVPAIAQTSEGAELYKKGEFKNASRKLKNEVKKEALNAELWNLLGLSLEKIGQYKEAQPALEMAVSLAESNSNFHSNLAFVLLRLKKYDDSKNKASKAIELDEQNANAFFIRSAARFGRGQLSTAIKDAKKAISINQKFGAAYYLERDLMYSQFANNWAGTSIEDLLIGIRESITSLEKCVEICDGDVSNIRQSIEENRLLYESLLRKSEDAKDASGNPDDDDNFEPMKVTAKRAPGYTQDARVHNVTGSVKLLVVFRFDGTIGPVVVLQGLSHGMTDSAIDATKSIKFKPEIRDGKPVSVVKTILYTFSTF